MDSMLMTFLTSSHAHFRALNIPCNHSCNLFPTLCIQFLNKELRFRRYFNEQTTHEEEEEEVEPERKKCAMNLKLYQIF